MDALANWFRVADTVGVVEGVWLPLVNCRLFRIVVPLIRVVLGLAFNMSIGPDIFHSVETCQETPPFSLPVMFGASDFHIFDIDEFFLEIITRNIIFK